jgi:hypothetical protein
MLIMLIDNEGRRLCQDKRWRDFANYGTYRECVKTYRAVGGAKAMARKLKARIVAVGNEPGVEREVDAVGKVIERRPTPDKPGYETVTHKQLADFVVEDFRPTEVPC